MSTDIPLTSETLAIECECSLADEVGIELICEEFKADDDGFCETCGHAEICHDEVIDDATRYALGAM